eukprot:SAG11_NODE_1689_length_4443_cov_7.468002_1_plen_113_part_00
MVRPLLLVVEAQPLVRPLVSWSDVVSHSSRATTHKEPECIGAHGQGHGQLVSWSSLAQSAPLVLYTRFEWLDWETGLLHRYTWYVLFGTDTAPDPVYSIRCKHTLDGFYTVL